MSAAACEVACRIGLYTCGLQPQKLHSSVAANLSNSEESAAMRQNIHMPVHSCHSLAYKMLMSGQHPPGVKTGLSASAGHRRCTESCWQAAGATPCRHLEARLRALQRPRQPSESRRRGSSCP
jgi:hypothetical protein